MPILHQTSSILTAARHFLCLEQQEEKGAIQAFVALAVIFTSIE
jgi:hypothetical protein